MGQMILFSGKGGVGKTSLSAATGLGYAKRGLRTLVISTDPAHSLGDVFGIQLGHEPTEICHNLHARELDVRTAVDLHWEQIGRYIEKFLASQGMDPLLAADLALVPGVEELVSLLESGNACHDWDRIILDCAPTGATVRLLTFPEAARWYMDRFFPAERKIMKAIRPVAERLTSLPLPADEVFAQAEALYARIAATSEMLRDSKRAVIRLVATPDQVVTAETRRALSMFHLYGIGVDAILMNRVLPAEVKDIPLLSKWVTSQQAELKRCHMEMSPLPIAEIPFQEEEPSGLERLERLSEALDSTLDIKPGTYAFEPEISSVGSNRAEIRFHLPLDEKQEIRLWVDGDELVFVFRSFRKRWALPPALTNYRVTAAVWEESRFCISMERASMVAER